MKRDLSAEELLKKKISKNKKIRLLFLQLDSSGKDSKLMFWWEFCVGENGGLWNKMRHLCVCCCFYCWVIDFRVCFEQYWICSSKTLHIAEHLCLINCFLWKQKPVFTNCFLEPVGFFIIPQRTTWKLSVSERDQPVSFFLRLRKGVQGKICATGAS